VYAALTAIFSRAAEKEITALL